MRSSSVAVSDDHHCKPVGVSSMGVVTSLAEEESSEPTALSCRMRLHHLRSMTLFKAWPLA